MLVSRAYVEPRNLHTASGNAQSLSRTPAHVPGDAIYAPGNTSAGPGSCSASGNPCLASLGCYT
jgi:hypothetical protein